MEAEEDMVLDHLLLVLAEPVEVDQLESLDQLILEEAEAEVEEESLPITELGVLELLFFVIQTQRQ